MNNAVFYGVGVGPGDPELITLKAIRTIESCSVIASPQTSGGGMMALDIARQTVSLEGKEILPLHFVMSRDKEELRRSHADAAQKIMYHLDAGQSVAMLNIGDVSIYATYSYMEQIIKSAGYHCQKIPGVPSFCAVAATLGENLTPQMDTPLHIVPAGFDDLEEVLGYHGAKVIMKAGKPLEQVKKTLREVGQYEKASLVQNCGLPDQCVAHTLDEAEENGGYFTTMVIRP